jgi:hypothetical protein
MPSRAPTHRELEVLRYLAVGMHIGMATGKNTHPVLAKGVEVIRIQTRTINALCRAGWIAQTDDTLTLTSAGRDVAECKTFVRAFAAGVGR